MTSDLVTGRSVPAQGCGGNCGCNKPENPAKVEITTIVAELPKTLAEAREGRTENKRMLYQGFDFRELMEHFGIQSMTESDAEAMYAFEQWLETRLDDVVVQEEVRKFVLALAREEKSLSPRGGGAAGFSPLWEGLSKVPGRERIVAFILLLPMAWT